MGIDWNPSRPEQIGVQRQDIGYAGTSGLTTIHWNALQFAARHTGPVTHVNIMSDVGSTAPTINSASYKFQQCPVFLDVYPATGAPWINPWDVQSEFIGATAVTGEPGMLNNDWTTPIQVSRIQTRDDNLGFFSSALGHSSGFWVQFDTASYDLTRRIVGVRVVCGVNVSWGITRVDQPPFTTGNHTFGMVKSNAAYVGYLDFVHLGEVLVDQTAPADATGWSWWTPQRIRDFRSGGPRAIKILPWQNGFVCDYVALQVFYATQPERRIGVGLAPPADPWRWTTFPMKSPHLTGSPSITTDQEYVAVLRKPWEPNPVFGVDRANMTWRYLNGAPLVTGWQSISGRGVASQIPQAGGAPIFTTQTFSNQPNTLNAIMCTGGPFLTGGPYVSAGTALETSQPYIMSRGAKIYNFLGSNIQASQTITVTGSATSTTFGQASAMVGWTPSSPPLPIHTIRAEVWTATGAPEVRVFSPVERNFLDIQRMNPVTDFSTGDANDTYRLVRWRFPESRTLPAGKYQIIFSTANTPLQRMWRLHAMSTYAHVVDQTFGRSTDVGVGAWTDFWSQLGPVTGPDGGTPSISWSGDLQATLMAVPPPVTGVAAAVGYTTAHHAEVCAGPGVCGESGCADQGAPFVLLTWSETSDTLSTEYEIQRKDDYDVTYRSVAIVAGRSTLHWEDYEARIGIASEYIIRSRRADGIAGDWSAPVRVSLPAGQVALTFTSNAATGLAVTYPEIWTGNDVDREFEFQEYDDVEFQQIYGRERQVAFHPIERKGIRFSRTLMMNALCTISPPTMKIFNPLRILSWAPIPYVCVRDGEGNRWYANIMVPDGVNIRPGERWFASVVVTEVSSIPSVVNTGVQQPADEEIIT